MQEKFSEVLEVAAEAGHVLLENGAEIGRVEETMERISKYYGVEDRNFFVLSNGIFTTGAGGPDPASRYANVEFIPLKGTQMDKIVEINRFSRDVEKGKYTLSEARAKVKEIRALPAKPVWEQLLGSAFGSAGFCILFGGSIMDCVSAWIVGLLLWAFVLWLNRPGTSKVMVNILGGSLATLLCMLLYRVGLGQNLGNMIIGAIIPLIPGVPFTNGIRDIADEDYIAGATRLMDSLMVFLGIALGVCMVFVIHGYIMGGLIQLHGALSDPFTANIPMQTVAAFVGTIGFAILFGVPRDQYVACGLVAALGWALYFTIHQYTSLSVLEDTFLTSLFITLISRYTAILRKCPVTVFLICGLFPLIPGAGVFWTTYFVASRQLEPALNNGLTAISITLAIVLAVVVVTSIIKRINLSPKRG